MQKEVKIQWLTLNELKDKGEELIGTRKLVSEYPKKTSTAFVYVWIDHAKNLHFLKKSTNQDVYRKDGTKKKSAVKYKTVHYAIDGYAPEREDIKLKKQAAEQEGIGKRAWQNFEKQYGKLPETKFQQFSEKDCMVEQYKYSNPIYSLQWLRVWTYDVNSCYPYFLTQPLPDEQTPLGQGVVEEGQCGFNIVEQQDFYDSKKKKCIVMRLTGQYAQYRFPLQIYPSLRQYAIDGYAKKKKDKAFKQEFVAFVGMLKYKAPFIRAYVLGKAQELIEGLSDEDTIINTVDSIVSLKPRLDLPIGDGLGEFKEEYIGCEICFESPVKKEYRFPDGTYEVVCSGTQESRFNGQKFYQQPRFSFDNEGNLIEQDGLEKDLKEFI